MSHVLHAIVPFLLQILKNIKRNLLIFAIINIKNVFLSRGFTPAFHHVHFFEKNIQKCSRGQREYACISMYIWIYGYIHIKNSKIYICYETHSVKVQQTCGQLVVVEKKFKIHKTIFKIIYI